MLQTTSPLLIGEHIRVEKRITGQVRSNCGEVVQSRPGQRTNDRTHGI